MRKTCGQIRRSWRSPPNSRDRCDGTPVFRVGHVSGGGDIAFLSLPLMLEVEANAAAKVLGQFVNGEVKLAP